MTTNQLEEKWIKLNGYAEDFQPSAAESKRIADFGAGYQLAMQDYGLANRSKDTGSTRDKPTPETEWETYCGLSYYNGWQVRRKNERGFDDGYHLSNGEEAKDLCAYLNQLERERDEAREELSEWRALELWGGTPELVHQWIKGQQSRIHAAQDAEAQAERLAEALERIKQDDDLPMSLRASSPKTIARTALAAYRADKQPNQ
jgi:hypothetical protein